ncbi:family 1 glycosylhydrolase [Phenylobacterium sp. LjRoot225]|uniref:glycoside hydrolase family 1 protein n=1 Tax=Phenylobacterium sp. LjRoot225 TaxID=3342285 RepID=UPI003ECC899C
MSKADAGASVQPPARPDRRAVLGAGAALALASAAPPAFAKGTRRFPSRFIWGVATAAHQVEGNNLNNDWWLLENVPGTMIREPSLDACDHYHRFAQDIALIARLGFGSYRFSIEWARVEPERGRYSSAELDHYRAMLMACRHHGLKTVVTLHHFTSPRWQAAAGGFENSDSVAAFAAYADRVVRHCGDLIDVICTFNEANLSFSDHLPARTLAPMLSAAAQRSGSSTFRSFLFDDSSRSKPIVRACHEAARAAIKAVRADLPVGMTLAISDIQDAPGFPGAGAAERSKRYDAWLQVARRDDFLGVQNYTRERFSFAGAVPAPAGTLRTQIFQEYYPEGLANAVRYAADAAQVPIYVTENGIGIEDDAVRIRYLNEAISGLHQCIQDGVDVRGYWHWSLMDNFEWLFGYGPKFGVIAVDRKTQTRTLKPSATWLGDVARRNAI